MSETTDDATAGTRVGVVGLGYVGLPLALAMADAGYDVTGVDIDGERIDRLRDADSYVTDVSDERLQTHLGDGFTPTTEYDALEDAEGVSICVPTPLRKSGQPDISYIVAASEQLGSVLQPGCTVVLESTVYPGATEEVVAPALAENGFVVGEDVFVAFSPERIDPGNEEYGPTEIPKVFGGVTDACGDRAEALYEPVFDQVIRVGSSTEAELVKLLENTFRSVNIALINELARVAAELDVDIWNTIDAAATKPFGFMPFYPGPGLGGHCIPVDPMYLSWKANQHGVDTNFIELADRVNRDMPQYVVQRVTTVLNDYSVPLADANLLILGAAYKTDVSDTRESPAVDIIDMLDERGATVTYHDPHVPELDVVGTDYESVPLTDDRLAGQDCVVLVTDHSEFDVSRVVEQSPLVFDTRNATADYRDRDNVYRL